jgi:outer membrane lipase/esterase
MPTISTMNVRRCLRACFVALAAALIGACGGGVESPTFVPTRLIVFGDELSALADVNLDGDARKYTVNALQADNVTLDCASNPLWIQTLAASYALVLAQCNVQGGVASQSRLYAAAGARVADVAAQIDQHFDLAGGFSDTDLVTVLAGTHDVIDAYLQYPGVAPATLVADVQAAGAALGAQVNRIAAAGGKVLIATIPDVGLSPFALAENVANTDNSRSALLSQLSTEFNTALRLVLPADGGRSIGLVLADQTVAAYAKTPGTTFTDVVDPACNLSLAPLVQDCTSLTLVAANAANTYIFADNIWLSPGMHRLIGAQAVAQARRNPF